MSKMALDMIPEKHLETDEIKCEKNVVDRLMASETPLANDLEPGQLSTGELEAVSEGFSDKSERVNSSAIGDFVSNGEVQSRDENIDLSNVVRGPPAAAGSVPVSPLQSANGYVEVDELLMDPTKQRFSAVPTDYNSLPTYPLRPSYREFHANLRPASRTVVFDGCPDNPYQPASVPIYQTATFVQPSSIEFGAYDYTRSGNPTRTALERQVAMLEHAYAAFAFTSGMSALVAVTRLLENGDTLLVGSDIYGGMYRLTTKITALAGVKVKFVDTWDLNAVKSVILKDKSVKMVHVETPSNPMMRITDMRALSEMLHSRNVLLSVDSTMMTPHLQQPLLHGCDIVVHSMTKFFGGHSDTSGGICCVANEALAQKIGFFQNAEGTGLAPLDCWLFLRGIKTMALRVERSQQSARHIAAFLRRDPLVKKLYYVGLEPSREDMLNSSPCARDFKVHMGQARGGGSVMSFVTGDVKKSRRIIDSLRIFKLTVSFGSCNSLCEMPSTLSHASIPAKERTIPEDLIRLSIGIEDVDDLLEDLKRAFVAAASDLPLVREPRRANSYGIPADISKKSASPIFNGNGNASEGPIETKSPEECAERSAFNLDRMFEMGSLLWVLPVTTALAYVAGMCTTFFLRPGQNSKS